MHGINFAHARRLGAALALVAAVTLRAHVGSLPSVHDAVAALEERLRAGLSEPELRALTAARVLEVATPVEREVLGTHHITFTVDVPVVVTVLRDARLGEEPFWLAERGFVRTGATLASGDVTLDAWERAFPAGEVGLGINSLRGGGLHYLVLVRAREAGRTPRVEALYPAQLRTDTVRPGVRPYADRDDELPAVPPELAGQTLVRTLYARRDDARLLGLFRWTEHPGARRPDQVVLTWSGDPRTSQTIQWRTSTSVRRTWVAWGPRAEVQGLPPTRFRRVRAATRPVEDRRL
jgi:hypothetical protein